MTNETIVNVTKTEVTNKPHSNKILTIIASLILYCMTVYVIYIGFSYYWDIMHSDIAADLVFVREAARQGTLFPYGWPHLQEMRLIHFTTVVLFVYLMTDNIHLSYPIAASFMLLVNMYLFYFMLSYRKRNILPIIIGFTVLLMFFSHYSQVSVFSMLFINSSLSTSLATIFLTIGIYMRLKENRSLVLAVILALLAFAQGIQSTRLLITLYLPLLIIDLYPILIHILKDKNFDFKEIKKSTIFTTIWFLCNLAGIALITALIRRDIVIVEYTLVSSSLRITRYAGLWTDIGIFVPQVFRALGLKGGVYAYSLEGAIYIGRLFAIIALPIILFKTSARLSRDNTIIHVLFTSVCASSFSMIIMTVGIGERFIFNIVVLFSVITVMVLEYLVKNDRKIITYIACLFIFIVVILTSTSGLNIERQPALIESRQTVTDFILEQGFTVGYGTFWHGLVLAAVGDFEFDVIYVNPNNLSTRPHGVTLERYNHNEDSVFLVLTQDQARNAYNSSHPRAILEQGERHDFRGGWVVYTFDQNPFR